MAIFERQPVKKVILDDTEPLSCVIENWRNVNGHTVRSRRSLRPALRRNFSGVCVKSAEGTVFG
jgi:hypothetical protein